MCGNLASSQVYKLVYVLSFITPTFSCLMIVQNSFYVAVKNLILKISISIACIVTGASLEPKRILTCNGYFSVL